MLSRTADHIYWMARYIERAENLARMLDVNNRMSLMPQSEHEVERLWLATLDSIGLLEAYQQRYDEVSARNVVHFMALDRKNLGSIYSCLRLARENAHAVRGTLTAELWETINATWLKLREYQLDPLDADELDAFFEWVKLRSHQFRGVSFATMMRDEANCFLRLGTFIERADNTARILDVKYSFIEEAPRRDEAGEYYQWSALLHSVSAFEIYRKVYRDLIVPSRVAELLILDPSMPRSLAYCSSEVCNFLDIVANQRSRETLRRAGELASGLRYGRIDDVLEAGLHAYLTRFIERINDLGNRIASDFLLPITG
ncbi:alpha-E domain-containing protein [Uliginosibacterium gangwonense]|uniref:alpha-E domain-containing protein n=1 Tax=Uliginosibacterium gangwonense TaxID=392736 RepID=UPI00039C5510|nr:alpha-E domain-containing protein [Uliginosibacterium gangwonense]